MTLPTSVSRVTYPGANSVGPFAFPFKIFAATDLTVLKIAVGGAISTLIINVDYTVPLTSVGASSGAITLTTALATGETLVIRRVLPVTQLTSIRNQGAYFPNVIEDEFDRLTAIDQQQQDILDRALTLSPALDPAAYQLTLPTPTAGQVVTGTGTGFTMSTIGSSTGIALPGSGRTVPSVSAYLANNAVFNVKDYGATGDGVTDDTTAIRNTITNLPAQGGTVFFPPGKYKMTDDVSAAVNSKAVVRFLGANGFTQRAVAQRDMVSVLYLKSLTKYWFTKSGTGNDVLQLESLGFDNSDGLGSGSFGTTCPGVVNSAGLNIYMFSARRCVFTDFGFAHTNVANNRAVIDIVGVWNSIDECIFGYCQNGRHLYIGAGSTTVRVGRTIFTVCREAYYIFNARGVSFDHCDWDSMTVIGASYLSEVTMRNPWFENIGFNNGTAYTTGLAPRAHGQTYGGGTLSGAGGTNGINTPIQMLYGKLLIEDAQIQDFATGGNNYTAAAWFEILGVANASTGAYFHLSGLINGSKPLFSTTSAMNSSDRDQDVYIEVHDRWAGAAGATGHGLFVITANADYRAVNWGTGNIAFNGGGLRKASIRRGQLHFDIYRGSNDFSAAPGAAVFPLGEQWQIGDRIILPTPVTTGYIGIVCTTAGTAGAVWKNFGAIL